MERETEKGKQKKEKKIEIYCKSLSQYIGSNLEKKKLQ